MTRIVSRCALALFFGALACAGPRWHGTGIVREPSAMANPSRRDPWPMPPPAATSARTAAQPVRPKPEPIELAPSGTPVTRAYDNLERVFPLHGLAFHVLAQVFSEPNERGVVSGYFRRGGRLRVKPAERGRGCDTRWHAVLGGGFICAGRGFLVGKSPPQFSPLPAAPSLQDALPYLYAKTTTVDTPLYLRAPSADEERSITNQLTAAKHQRASLDALRSKHAKHLLGGNPSAKQLDAKPERSAPAPPPSVPDYVRTLMQPGYYVSLDEGQSDGASPLLRTVRGDLVPARGQSLVRGSELHGTLLEADGHGQLALVYRAGAPSFTRDAITGALSRTQPLQALEALYLSDEVVRDRRREYRVSQAGRLVPSDALRLVPNTPRPPFVPAGARYIAIQLSSQTLVAYDGNTPVFATLVSTGKAEHETPTGIFRIEQKHVSTTMDGEVGSDEAYRIEDVPWTMYFSGSLALHAAFWHERFGRPRSHGCVNLAPLDARWLFEWAGPHLPSGFHGVVATRDNPGTFVVIAP